MFPLLKIILKVCIAKLIRIELYSHYYYHNSYAYIYKKQT